MKNIICIVIFFIPNTSIYLYHSMKVFENGIAIFLISTEQYFQNYLKPRQIKTLIKTPSTSRYPDLSFLNIILWKK